VAADHLTVGAVARLLGIPAWKIRKAVDSLNTQVPRAGQYRLVSRVHLGKLAIELERRGWLQVGEGSDK
jgi:hypothetical protein